MSKYDYPEPRIERKEKKINKNKKQNKYNSKSCSYKIINQLKEQKARRKLQKTTKPTINDPEIKRRSKNAVKEW